MRPRNVVTKADLPIIEDTPLPGGGTLLANRPSLYCPSCGETYSATPGDYWQLSPGHVFTCAECEDEDGAAVPMALVRQREVTVPWDEQETLDNCLQAIWDEV